MRSRTLIAGSLTLLFVLASPAAFGAPTIGQPAPDFIFQSAERTYASADYVGESARKKGVVVAWFPKAFTPG